MQTLFITTVALMCALTVDLARSGPGSDTNAMGASGFIYNRLADDTTLRNKKMTGGRYARQVLPDVSLVKQCEDAEKFLAEVCKVNKNGVLVLPLPQQFVDAVKHNCAIQLANKNYACPLVNVIIEDIEKMILNE